MQKISKGSSIHILHGELSRKQTFENLCVSVGTAGSGKNFSKVSSTDILLFLMGTAVLYRVCSTGLTPTSTEILLSEINSELAIENLSVTAEILENQLYRSFT